MRRNDQRASGPALLLELARSLNAGPTPEYTVWLSWIDGDALDTVSDGGSSQVRLGTQSLVDEWSRGQEFSQIRAAIFFGDVGDRDKPIGRDIDSPRVYREIFWQVAQDLGYGSSFPADGPYGLSSTGRRTFAQANLRSSIALANLRTGHIEPPVEPPYHGPLSEVKMTSVFSSSDNCLSLSSTRPTDASNSDITSA